MKLFQKFLVTFAFHCILQLLNRKNSTHQKERRCVLRFLAVNHLRERTLCQTEYGDCNTYHQYQNLEQIQKL